MYPARILFLLISLIALLSTQALVADTPSVSDHISRQAIEEKLEGEFNAEEIVATSSWIHSIGVADWLGPLAPVALSPFFGVTCLSGLALWGPEWTTDNAMLGSAGPLRNESLFFVFLILTAITSFPRLTKVSKPFAQAIDRLETYAVIVILLMIKFVASMETPGDEPVAVVQLGVLSVTLDTLLAIAMIINVLVINSVKFFFEFLVWLTPIPLVDAIFEFCNKSLCAAMMAIYAFSPPLATVINLAILLVAAFVLRWISRRVRFYRTIVLDPILASLWSGFGKPKRPELIVFPKSGVGPFKAKSRLKLMRHASIDQRWTLEEANWWVPAKRNELTGSSTPKVRMGWTMHTIVIEESDGSEITLCFSRRYSEQTLRELIETIGLEWDDRTNAADIKIATEFS